MYIIMVYDVGVERVNNVLKIARRYLHWVQNSVLEGELSPANFERLKDKISSIIDKNNDSIIFYKLRTTKYLTREIIGKQKGKIERFF